MNFLFSLIDDPIELKEDAVNVLVIERHTSYYKVAMDLYNQCNKVDSGVVLSKDNKEIDISKKVEFVTSIVPFDINKKSLVSKLISQLKEQAVNEYYVESCEIVSAIQSYIATVADALTCDVDFDEIDVSQLFKCANIRLSNDSDSLCDMIIDYCRSVVAIEGDKLFIFLGLGNYIDESDYCMFADNMQSNSFKVLMIENAVREFGSEVNTIIIDQDNCVI